MTYIKFEHRHLGHARWIDATPAAFVVHTWALDYCNEQRTDGLIPAKVAHRLLCPVEPAEIPGAFDVLIELELWERTHDGYRSREFLAHGLSAEEQTATQDKWATDKRRRRLHGVGNHQLCTPRGCKAAAVSGLHEQVESDPPTSGRLDPSIPDPNPKGSESGHDDTSAIVNAAARDDAIDRIIAKHGPKLTDDEAVDCVDWTIANHEVRRDLASLVATFDIKSAKSKAAKQRQARSGSGGPRASAPKVREQLCEDHPTQPASTCRSCNADVLAGERPEHMIGRRAS